jgi:hypothetical protein
MKIRLRTIAALALVALSFVVYALFQGAHALSVALARLHQALDAAITRLRRPT